MGRYLQIAILACVICFASNIGCQNAICAHPSVNTYYRYNHPSYDMAVEKIIIDLEHAGKEYISQYIGGDTNSYATIGANNARNIVISSRTAMPRSIKRHQSILRQINSTTFKVGKTIDCRTIISHIEGRGLLPMSSKSCNEFITLICRFIIEP